MTALFWACPKCDVVEKTSDRVYQMTHGHFCVVGLMACRTIRDARQAFKKRKARNK